MLKDMRYGCAVCRTSTDCIHDGIGECPLFVAQEQKKDKFIAISKETRPFTLWVEEDGTVLCHYGNKMYSHCTSKVNIGPESIEQLCLVLHGLMNVSHKGNRRGR